MSLTSSELRAAWSLYRCSLSRLVSVDFPGEGDRVWPLRVASGAAGAWQAFADVMSRHRYAFREIAGGTYNCRHVNHDPAQPMSTHAYGLAIDLNPSANPQGGRRHDYPPGLIADLEALRTIDGAVVFAWGGRWSPIEVADPMHWQIACTPENCASGIDRRTIGAVADPITRASKADDGLESLEAAFARARAAGAATEHTQPGGVTFNDELMAVLDRLGLLNIAARVEALEGGGSAGIDSTARARVRRLAQHLRDAPLA